MYRLLTTLAFVAALVFGFGYVPSPTYAQDTDQTEAGSDQAPTDGSAQTDVTKASTEAECKAAGGDWNADAKKCGPND
jgi:hypothetical protein